MISKFTLPIFILFLFILLGFSLGLGVDEAHYVLYSKHLSWSYFDHPPLVGWFHYPFQKISQIDFMARVPALLLFFWTSFEVWLLFTNNQTKKKIIKDFSTSTQAPNQSPLRDLTHFKKSLSLESPSQIQYQSQSDSPSHSHSNSHSDSDSHSHPHSNSHSSSNSNSNLSSHSNSSSSSSSKSQSLLQSPVEHQNLPKSFFSSHSSSTTYFLILWLCFSTCLIPFGLFLFLLPDSLLIPLSFRIYSSVKNCVQTPRALSNWILLGLWIGLSGLSKYSAILIVIPTGIFLISHLKTKLFKNFGFYLLIIISSILITPVLYWNFLNEWISFKYQMNHVVGESQGYQAFLKSLLLQWLGYGIFLSPLLTVFFIKLLLKKKLSLFYDWPSLFILTWSLFFIYSSFADVILPHWTLLAWVWIFILYFKNETHCLKSIKLQLVFNLIFLTSLVIFLNLPVKYNYKVNLNELRGWPELMNYLEDSINKDYSIAFTNWTYGSRSNYYASPTLSKRLFIQDHRFDQFDIWEKDKTYSSKRAFIVFHNQNIMINEFSTWECPEDQIKEFEVKDNIQEMWSHKGKIYFCTKK